MLKLNDFLARLWIHSRNRSTSINVWALAVLCAMWYQKGNSAQRLNEKGEGFIEFSSVSFRLRLFAVLRDKHCTVQLFQEVGTSFQRASTHVANKIKDIACQADLGHMKYLYNDTLGTVRNKHIKREINFKRIIFVFGYQFDQ